MPEGERALLESPGGFTPPGVTLRPYTPDVLLTGGETITLAGIDFEVFSVPGHSPAHVAYHADGCLFSGDVLFAGSVGRTDLPGADWDTLLASIRGLVDSLPPETVVYPGHGPTTTLGAELEGQPVPGGAAGGARRMSDATKIERPRGTHDVLPSEHPQWQRVTGELERLCSLYGYRPISTPVFEDTALFERTSGAGSDVVQKEMYTFSDRSDRSLTLRPEGTAPICRAYVEHGFHRDPQPAKLFTIATMYRYGAPGRGRYREHWQASVEAIGSDDPAIDAELIQLYDTWLRRLGVTPLRARGELDRLPRVPPRVPGGAPLLARRERGAPRRGDEREGLGEPAPRLRQLRGQAGEACVPRSTRHPRSATRCAPSARRASRPCGAISTPPESATRSSDSRPRSRLLLAHDLGVHRPARERERDHLGRRPLRLPRRGDRRPAHARGRVRGRHRAACCSRSRRRARRRRRPRRIDVFFAREPEAPAGVVPVWLARLREAGVSCDTDYAGRSLKGQLTQAGRLGASTTVIAGAEHASIRRGGQDDLIVRHEDVLETLTK